MKILLACLMCMLLNTVQCFAIDGGPWGGSGGVAVTGNYAGVLVPIPVAPDPSNPTITLPPDNSLALFTINVHVVGLASGNTSIFRNGIAYTGTMTGVADPDTQKLTGILTSSFIVLSASETGSTTIEIIQAEYDASGKLDTAKIVQNTNANSTASARIRGKASLTYIQSFAATPADERPEADSGGPISYRIIGFKQSEATS